MVYRHVEIEVSAASGTNDPVARESLLMPVPATA